MKREKVSTKIKVVYLITVLLLSDINLAPCPYQSISLPNQTLRCVSAKASASGTLMEDVEDSFRIGNSRLPTQRLDADIKIISVKKYNVPLIQSGRPSEECILNAGVIEINKDERLLFVRRALLKEVLCGDTCKSIIALFVHNVASGKIITIDREMLMPSSPDNEIAYEDARAVEYGGKIYLFFTLVNKGIRIIKDDEANEQREEEYTFYYPAVVSHEKGSLISELRHKIEDPSYQPKWSWSKPKSLMADERFMTYEIKDFVPFPKPFYRNGREYWLATYRPDEKERTTIRLAVSYKGLEGPWHDSGMYRREDVKGRWAGSSFCLSMPQRLIAKDKHGNQSLPIGALMFFHEAWHEKQRAWLRNGSQKYYDLGVRVIASGNPLIFAEMQGVIKPSVRRAYDRHGWVPGADFSCGGVISGYDPEKGIIDIDIYYSGADTVILLARVKCEIVPRNGHRNYIRNNGNGKRNSESPILPLPVVPQNSPQIAHKVFSACA